MEPPVYTKPDRSTGDNLDWNWGLKWGQSCGAETLTCGSDAVSRSIMLEVS